MQPEEVLALGVDRIVSNADKDRLVEILERDGMIEDSDPLPTSEEASVFAGAHGGRTRAFVKVQDGCDNRCAFCIVTVARGTGRSRSADQVVAEVQRVVGLGYREVVLSGVHLGSWGADRGRGETLADLVRAVLSHTEVERLRMSSLEPWDLSPGFFELWSDRRLQPHLHLPLQSGCDSTLRRMSRRTSQREFRRLVEEARRAVPGLALSTDIIVGFPGECDAEFEDSLAFTAETGFSRLHVFRYSPRPGTAAARMDGQIPVPVAQQRSRRMHEVAAGAAERFLRGLVGSDQPVLWECGEERESDIRWTGLTGNYARVVTETDRGEDLRNRILQTRLDGVLPGAAHGTCVGAAAPCPPGVG